MYQQFDPRFNQHYRPANYQQHQQQPKKEVKQEKKPEKINWYDFFSGFACGVIFIVFLAAISD